MTHSRAFSFAKYSAVVLAPALATFGAVQSASAQDTIATDSGDLVITPVHHGSVVLTWNGKTIIADPTGFPPSPESGAADYADWTNPDLILVTHTHGDHFNAPTLSELAGDKTTIIAPQSVADGFTPDLTERGKVMANGDSDTISDIKVEAVPMYNITEDRLKFHPKGQFNGYVLTLGDKRVYIAGDTEGTPELRELKDIDIAFIPMNLPYTQTPEEAADWINAFDPAIVYPYHFGQSDLSGLDAAVEDTTEVRIRDSWY